MGSSSWTLWPPTRNAPEARVLSKPPSSTFFRTSSPRTFEGKPTMFKATMGRPPIANTSLMELAAAICPQT